MVHEGGNRYYKHLYGIIDSEQYPLTMAMRTVYACDKRQLEEVILEESHINTFNEKYRGCKILEIFEHNYLE